MLGLWAVAGLLLAAGRHRLTHETLSTGVTVLAVAICFACALDPDSDD